MVLLYRKYRSAAPFSLLKVNEGNVLLTVIKEECFLLQRSHFGYVFDTKILPFPVLPLILWS